MPGTSGTPIISVRDLRKRYGQLTAVDGVSFDVAEGEVFGILGPNGAGKTTTLEMIEGMRPIDEGSATIDGIDVRRDPREVKRRIGIQLQSSAFFDELTLVELLHLFGQLYGRDVDPQALLALIELTEKAKSQVRTLSGGQKQRFSIASALVNDPRVLFLDEPTTGLDPQSRRQLWGLIEGFKSAGRGILLTTHYMEEAERLCDRVAIVDHGRVIALGTPRELIAALRAEHVLEFALADDAIVDAAPLRGIEGVCAATRHDGTYRLQVDELHRAMPGLLGELRRQNVQLAELRTHSATLEDVFVSLTGRHLRDE
jgi:ABC-2 type transport system ATP-binding protein